MEYKTSQSTQGLQQSGIRAASAHCAKVGGINLGQGICDLPVLDEIKQAAFAAIKADKSIYSACEGVLPLRQAIAKKTTAFNHFEVDPANEIIVTHGSTGAFVCAVKTLFDPGDEVILFEPFYGYHKNICSLNGIAVATVPIDLNGFRFNQADLEAVVNSKTRGIVICTPNNPSGKVYAKEELVALGEFARAHNLWIITDEIYEYITYPGYEHISLAALNDFKDRTLTISGFSKTYNMTGWRLGYATGPASIIAKMALVQDLLYVCPATPLQHAIVTALDVEPSYYPNMRQLYLKKRDLLVNALTELGFKVAKPQGAYYLMANFSALGFADDQQAVNYLLEKAKVAAVSGRSFYLNPSDGKSILRFCYALEEAKIEQAVEQLKQAFS